MKGKKGSNKKKYGKMLAGAGVLLAAICIGGFWWSQSELGDKEADHSYETHEGHIDSENLLVQIESYSGYTRSVSQEEYDFYEYFVEREFVEGKDEMEIDSLVKEYINEVNAVFYLGNKLDLCEPYSFELMKQRMEQENRSRALKKEKGEVIYGLEEFTLGTYYQYTRENLETDIYMYLEEHMDETLMKEVEQYYERNKDSFEAIESIKYEETTNQGTELITADQETLEFLGNADMGLADFLLAGKVGDVFTDPLSLEGRTVEIKEITYTDNTFENNKEIAVYHYIREELYPSCIEGVAQRNPVTFVLNQE